MRNKSIKKLQLKIKTNTISVEIADNIVTKTIGLMGRKTLENNWGMLFVFKKEHKPLFWMFKTVIPLDILWINRKYEIVDITKETIPWKNKSVLKTLFNFYKPKTPIKYALEVNAKYTEKNNIKIGDKVIFL